MPDGIDRDEEGELTAPFQWPQPLRPPLGAKPETEAAAKDQAAIPAWLSRPAPSPKMAPQPLRPSRGLAEPDPLPAALPSAAPATPGDAAMLRGRIVHLLLQFLPGVPADKRAAAAERLLAGEIDTASELAATLRAEADAVLAHSDLKALFEGDSRAEVAIVGNVATANGDYAVSGRIDRLLRDATGWHLVDFKTDRGVPASPAEVDPAYVLQLALYRRLLMDIEPGVPVGATLVFAAGPNVMPIPSEMMERALERLGVRANPIP